MNGPASRARSVREASLVAALDGLELCAPANAETCACPDGRACAVFARVPRLCFGSRLARRDIRTFAHRIGRRLVQRQLLCPARARGRRTCARRGDPARRARLPAGAAHHAEEDRLAHPHAGG